MPGCGSVEQAGSGAGPRRRSLTHATPRVNERRWHKAAQTARGVQDTGKRSQHAHTSKSLAPLRPSRISLGSTSMPKFIVRRPPPTHSRSRVPAVLRPPGSAWSLLGSPAAGTDAHFMALEQGRWPARGLRHARCATPTAPLRLGRGQNDLPRLQSQRQVTGLRAWRSSRFMQRQPLRRPQQRAPGCTLGPGDTQGRAPARCASGALAHACDAPRRACPPSCGAARNPPSIERGSSRAGERMWAPPSFPGAGRARTATPQRHAAAGSRTCAGHHRGPWSPAPRPQLSRFENPQRLRESHEPNLEDIIRTST